MPNTITPKEEMSCLKGHVETKNRLLNLEWWNEEAAADIFKQQDTYEEFARFAHAKIKQARNGSVSEMEKACIRGYPETKRRLLEIDHWTEDESDFTNVYDLFSGSFGFINFTYCVVEEIKRVTEFEDTTASNN